MKIAVFVKNPNLIKDDRLLGLTGRLRSEGVDFYLCGPDGAAVAEGTDCVFSVGGDGTFLSAARFAAQAGVPVLGVNLGRMGFLADATAEDALRAVSSGAVVVEDRDILSVSGLNLPQEMWPFALNEVAVTRRGPEMLGVDVVLDGRPLPTYWADGVLVATSSGSTAYSLSVGGPICSPDSKVLIISPIAPHNLNLRPLIVPDSSSISISFQSRSGEANLSIDNQSAILRPSDKLDISLAQFSLKRIRLSESDFIGALKSKLFWGEDVRNR